MVHQSEEEAFFRRSDRKKGRRLDPDADPACNSTSKQQEKEFYHGTSEAFQKIAQGSGFKNIITDSDYLGSTPCQNGQGKTNGEQHKRKDKDRHESRGRLKNRCSSHRHFVTSSYENRKLSSEQREMFDALLGIQGKYADHMPASDVKLRRFMGKRIIDEMYQLWLLAKHDSRLKVYFVTLIDDEFLYNERSGKAKPMRFMHKVQAVIRQYTSFNAFGVIENQALTNYPKGDFGKFLSVHAHVICWGYDEGDCKELLDHTKGFRTALTKKPILFKEMKLTEGDFTTVGGYLAKPPTEGKVIDYSKLEEGKACLSSITDGMEKYHHLRLFEYGAKIPMEHTIFGVRHGATTRQRIVTQMKSWQKIRKGTEIQLGEQVNDLFKTFISSNKKLKNYQPMPVIYKRDQT